MFILFHPLTKQIETFEPVERGILVGCCQEDGALSRDTARRMWRDLVDSGWVRVDEKPYLDRQRSRFSVGYLACGTISALEDWREGVYSSYHPAGYDTYIQINELYPGVGIASGSWQNSCD